MGVGVEVAVDQHLAQAGAQQRLGQPGTVKAEGVDPLDLADADPVQPLHDQDPGRRQLGVDGRHVDLVAGGQCGDLGRVAGLQPEVELLAQPVGELPGQLGHPVVGTPGGARLGHPGRLGQDLQVAVDRLGDARPLHLDHHRLATVQPAPVGLGDRGGGQRLGSSSANTSWTGRPSSASSSALTDSGAAGGAAASSADGWPSPSRAPKPCLTAIPVIWA
jgi:hypothetical protein